MTGTPRYAIYSMPAVTSALWRFGCRVVGYDPAEPDARPQPFEPLRVALAAGAFSEPARYGFHATLKAPFELAARKTEAQLLAAAADFAARQPPLPLGHLKIATLERFVALIPEVAPAALEPFAVDCVCDFDSFRAPLSAADRDRRLKVPMTTTQLVYLDAWGYPYVFEEFRFHMTLAGPLSLDQLAPITETRRTLYAPVDVPVRIDGIAIFRQPARTARFELLHRFAFAQV